MATDAGRPTLRRGEEGARAGASERVDSPIRRCVLERLGGAEKVAQPGGHERVLASERATGPLAVSPAGARAGLAIGQPRATPRLIERQRSWWVWGRSTRRLGHQRSPLLARVVGLDPMPPQTPTPPQGRVWAGERQRGPTTELARARVCKFDAQLLARPVLELLDTLGGRSDVRQFAHLWRM